MKKRSSFRPSALTVAVAGLFVLGVFPLVSSQSRAQSRSHSSKVDTATLLSALGDALGGAANIKKIHTFYFEWKASSVHVAPSDSIQTFQVRTHEVGREWLTSGGSDRLESRAAVMQGEPVLQVLAAGKPPNGWILVGDQGFPSGNSTGQMQGPDLERAISHVYWTTFAYLTSAGLAGRVNYLPHAGAPDYLLELDPEGGAPIKAYLNGKTFLPDKVQIGDDPYKMVIVPKDWKYVNGVRFPLDMTVRLFDSQMKSDYTFTKIQVNVKPPKNAFAQPTPAL